MRKEKRSQFYHCHNKITIYAMFNAKIQKDQLQNQDTDDRRHVDVRSDRLPFSVDACTMTLLTSAAKITGRPAGPPRPPARPPAAAAAAAAGIARRASTISPTGRRESSAHPAFIRHKIYTTPPTTVRRQKREKRRPITIPTYKRSARSRPATARTRRGTEGLVRKVDDRPRFPFSQAVCHRRRSVPSLPSPAPRMRQRWHTVHMHTHTTGMAQADLIQMYH